MLEVALPTDDHQSAHADPADRDGGRVCGSCSLSGKINDEIAQTFSTVALAFVLSVAVGFALGALIHALPRVRRALDPCFASYYAVPFFVFYPLLIVLFGLNDRAADRRSASCSRPPRW